MGRAWPQRGCSKQIMSHGTVLSCMLAMLARACRSHPSHFCSFVCRVTTRALQKKNERELARCRSCPTMCWRSLPRIRLHCPSYVKFSTPGSALQLEVSRPVWGKPQAQQEENIRNQVLTGGIRGLRAQSKEHLSHP